MATKKELEVLYQIDSDVLELQAIADILEDLDLEGVKKAVSELKKDGLLKTKEGKLIVTKKGKEAIEKNPLKALGV